MLDPRDDPTWLSLGGRTLVLPPSQDFGLLGREAAAAYTAALDRTDDIQAAREATAALFEGMFRAQREQNA